MKTTMQSSTKDVSFKWNTFGFRPQTQKLERQIHDLADVVLNERYLSFFAHPKLVKVFFPRGSPEEMK